jgi:aspartate racemase
MKNISIGIIGGMGPQASALLHTKIVNAASAELGAHDCNEFPLITHVSIPAIDFITQPNLRHKNKAMLESAAKTLRANEPDIVVVACNTAHLLIEEVPALANLPLVSLPDSVIKDLEAKGIKRAGLLASSTTIATKLYHEHAAKAKIDIVVLPQSEQRKTAEVIRSVIAGKPLDDLKLELSKQIGHLQAQGVDIVILGCTELSVLNNGLMVDIALVDSLTAATNAVVKRTKTIMGESR